MKEPRIVDLTHPLEHGQPNFPLDPSIEVTPHNTVASTGYNLAKLTLATHQGTHLDAPFHFFDDGATVDRMDLGLFYGPAHLIDLAPGSALAPKTLLTAEMFQAREHLFQPGARILYRTGWDRAFGQPAFFTDYPTLALEAARWIASRRIALLGMDTPTPSADWKECHLILLAKGVEIVLVESLANLDRLPPRFLFAGFPLAIKGRDGSPIRAVGIVD